METKKTDSLEFYNLCNYLSRMRRRKIFVKTKADGGPELLKKKKKTMSKEIGQPCGLWVKQNC